MKRELKKQTARILAIAVAVTVMVAFGPQMSMMAYAEESDIYDFNVVVGDQQITVSGKTGDELTAVTISVTGGNLSNPKVKTASVNDDNTFSVTIDLDPGTYTVTAENYNGGTPVKRDNIVVTGVTKYDLWVGGEQVTSENLSGVGNVGDKGTWTYEPGSNTLTLNGYHYTGTGYKIGIYSNAIYYDDRQKSLNLDLQGENVITQSGVPREDRSCGIIARGGLTITGTGSLTADAKGTEGQGVSYAIAISDGDLNIKGGTIIANSYKSKYYCIGVYVEGDENSVNITGGSLTATAENHTDQEDGYCSLGIFVVKQLTIGEKAGKLIASGHTGAIRGPVINKIPGKGWKDLNTVETDQPITIDVCSSPRELKYKDENNNDVYYQNVQFEPANGNTGEDPAPTPTPEPSPIPEPAPTPEPAPIAVSGTPLTKLSVGKTSMTIAWQKTEGVDGYDIFFSRCNYGDTKVELKNVKTIEGNDTFNWTNSGLKPGTSYKAYVKAFIMTGSGKQYVMTSPLMHAYTDGGSKKYTNARSVKVNKTRVSINTGKTFKIKAKVKKLKKGRKLMPAKHVAKVRYLSTDTSIATVSGKGKIKGVKAGTCYVYALAHNGVFKKITVTVN